MNCNKVEKLLLEDASIGERMPVREHLANCSPCRTLYQQLSDIEWLSVSLSGGKGAPQNFSTQIFAQTIARPLWRHKTALAAMALLFAAGAANLWAYLAGDEALPSLLASQAVQQEAELTYPLDLQWENLQERRFESRQSSFVEVELQSPSQGRYILQVPSTIRIQRGQSAPGADMTRVSY